MEHLLHAGPCAWGTLSKTDTVSSLSPGAHFLVGARPLETHLCLQGPDSPGWLAKGVHHAGRVVLLVVVIWVATYACDSVMDLHTKTLKMQRANQG